MKSVSVLIEYDPETKTYGATSEQVPDVFAISDNREDVVIRFARAANLHIEALRERGVSFEVETRREIVTVDIEAA